MKQFKKAVLMFSLLFLPFIVSYADEVYPFQTARQESQFKHLLSELRCLVCQNQNLAESNSGLAEATVTKVSEQIRAANCFSLVDVTDLHRLWITLCMFITLSSVRRPESC